MADDLDTSARPPVDESADAAARPPVDESADAAPDTRVDTSSADGRDRAAKIELAKLAAESAAPAGDPAPSDDPSLGVHRRQLRRWWHRHLDSEERQRIMTELAIRRSPDWGVRFSTMLTLSVIVAVMGLSADSAAVVIGAMLLAPLMTPVLATAACISMALFRKSVRSFGVVVAATVGAIALSYVLAMIVVNGELPREVTSRTAPDIRDLVVALGAGTAGAYATVRRDVSTSLPGVAVAVALVPPLAAAGMSLEAGNMTFARGALLLYTTNLAAIVFAGVVVFVVTGFVPPRRLANTFRHSALVALAVGAIVVAIAIPLYQASQSAIAASEREIDAIGIVDSWLTGADVTREPEVSFSDGRIFVRVTSFDPPIDLVPLTEAMRSRFGDDLLVSVEWDKVEPATTPVDTLPAVTDTDRRDEQVADIVQRWLDGADDRRLDSLQIVDQLVRIDASGVGDPPDVNELTDLLDAELGEPLAVRLTWLERARVEPSADPTPDELLARRIEELAEAFAADHDVVVLATTYEDGAAVLELAGEAPPDVSDLVDQVGEVLGPAGAVSVLFAERIDITAGVPSTTTAATTTTTTIPTPTTTTIQAPTTSTVPAPSTTAAAP